MESKTLNEIEKVKIKFYSFTEYTDWALVKLAQDIPGLVVVRCVDDYTRGSYRCKTYELQYGVRKFEFDFEMESDFEWYTGNKQEDPDWVYSPLDEQYQIWGGVERLAARLRAQV